MRLIDADDFRRILREIQTDAEHFDNEQRRNDIGSIMALLDKQPTAFDTEKVVEQLEQYANGKICNMHRNCPYIDNDNIACENCGALGAIDIVKKGGVE